MTESSHRSLSEHESKAIFSALSRLTSGLKNADNGKLLKQTRARIGTLPVVRRKHRIFTGYMATAVIASCLLIGVTFLLFGPIIAVLVLGCGVFTGNYLSRLMSPKHEAAPRDHASGYDELYSMVAIVMRRHGYLKELTLPGQLLSADDAPNFWGTAYALAKKVGLPAPVLCVIDDPKEIAYIMPHHGTAAIVLERRTLAWAMKKKGRLRVLLAHEFGHWLERDWARNARFSLLVGILGGISCQLSAIAVGAVASAVIRGSDTLPLIHLLEHSICGILLALALGTIANVHTRLNAEYAADAISADLIGSRAQAAQFWEDARIDWVRDPYNRYCPFRKIVHPTIKERAQALRKPQILS